MWSDNSGTAPKDWNKQYMHIKHRENMYYGEKEVCLLFLALVSFKKYMPPPLPYFKVNIYPFPLPHFASIFFAYL
jgi:hypothetical protein